MSDDEAMFASAVAHQPKNQLAQEIEDMPTSAAIAPVPATIETTTAPADNNTNTLQAVQDPTPEPTPEVVANPVKIHIQDAEKRVASMESYISYQIVTSGAYEGNVRRRFNDFRWLQEQLRLVFPYHFIPPLPQKIVIAVDRFAPEFVEARRAALETYLQTISEHAKLSTSSIFTNFLTNQTNFKSDCMHEIGQTGAGGVFSKFSSSISQAFSTKVRDPDFNDMVSYVELYKDRVAYTDRVTQRVLNETTDAAQTTNIMPSKFRQWADIESAEKAEDGLAEMLELYAKTSINCADIYVPIEKFLRSKFQPYLQQQERLCDEVHVALKNRDRAQFDLEKCRDNSSVKQHEQQVATMQYQDDMQRAKLAHEIKVLEDKQSNLEKDKLKADAVVRDEMLRWNNDKNTTLKDMFKELSSQNINLIDSQIEIYEKLLSDLEQHI